MAFVSLCFFRIPLAAFHSDAFIARLLALGSGVFFIPQVSRRHTAPDVLEEAALQAPGPAHDTRRMDNGPVNHMSAVFGLVSKAPRVGTASVSVPIAQRENILS